MEHKNTNSYPELGIELELPFYLRSIGYNEYTPKFDFPEGHIRHRIVIVLEGECKLRLGTYSFRLHQHDGFFVRANYPCCYESLSEKCSTQWVVFDGYATIPLFSRLGLENYMVFHNLDTEHLSMNLSEMYFTSINTDRASRLQNSAMVYKFLIDVYTQSEQGIRDAEGKLKNQALLYAKRHIDQYYASDLTQEKIAREADITPQHLCRLFKKYIHMTPIHYLNYVRIEHAKELLRKTAHPVSRIGEMVGYGSPHYFATVFRKLERKTPSQYREMARIAAKK